MKRVLSGWLVALAWTGFGDTRARGDDAAVPAAKAPARDASKPSKDEPNVCEPEPATTAPSNPPSTNKPLPDPPTPYIDDLPIPKRAVPIQVVANPSDKTRVEYYRIEMKLATTQLHSRLPATTPIFGYDGTYPGPTFDVDYKTKVVVEWVNNIGMTQPDKQNSQAHIINSVIVAPTPDSLFPQDWPGSENGQSSTIFKPAPIWTVVHLHGGSTPPGSDGWPDDAYIQGQSALFTYPGERRGTMLWYHDHADMITRLNVYAGLAGIYVVRDEKERSLNLPNRSGIDELPLLIQDRNLEVDPDQGTFTGAMLHKLAADGAEFYGPYTLVNGRIWPRAQLEPRHVRLRLLNGSNGRFYRLRLKNEETGAYSTEEFRQIGTEAGLLAAPVEVPAAGLTLSPGERADVVLDLTKYRNKKVSLVNDYPMPMAPVAVQTTATNIPDQPNISNKPKFEQVLQFQIKDVDVPADDYHVPNALDPIDRPKSADAVLRRRIYLIEDPPGTLTINGRLFHDRIEEVVHLGDTEIWEIVNTTSDFHPFHMHLVDFEVVEREQFRYTAGSGVKQLVASLRGFQAGGQAGIEPPGIVLTGKPCPVDKNEQGFKDTVRVGPMTVTRLVVKFDSYTGRYIYHCHILEHEDMEMMRPYLILPQSPQGFDLMGPNLGLGVSPGPAALVFPPPSSGAGANPAAQGASRPPAAPRGMGRHGR
jgi:spore coat protein A